MRGHNILFYAKLNKSSLIITKYSFLSRTLHIDVKADQIILTWSSKVTSATSPFSQASIPGLIIISSINWEYNALKTISSAPDIKG